MARQRNQPLPSGPARPTRTAETPLPIEERRSRQVVHAEEHYQGQIPHPAHLERFEVLAPGATDRFIGMVERQEAHRQRMEWRFMNFNGASQILGTLLGGITVLGGMGGGIYLVMRDKDVQGFTTMLGTIGTVATIFLSQRKSQAVEKQRKRDAQGR